MMKKKYRESRRNRIHSANHIVLKCNESVQCGEEEKSLIEFKLKPSYQ
jgi:hypothetical protein